VSRCDSAPILAREELAGWSEAQRAAGRRIGFTNGCFDLLHPGHLASLQAGAARADCLLVAVNADASVRRLKGAGRPLLPEAARAALLAALRPVSAVTIFAEPTPLAVILLVRPTLIIKGGEYAEADIVGAREVRAWGGEVVRVDMHGGWSTTQLIANVKRLP
jgi:D-beta-D-heptose 7-phosphate kinase/D-beta-D-heptose 1-phosphate adenosyltransferase